MFRASKTQETPELGTLTRSRGVWRGVVALPDRPSVRVAIMGPRNGPDPAALALASTISERFETWRPSIEAALHDHASDAGAKTVVVPEPSYVAVISVDGLPTIEFGYDVPWDDDHTIGVCIRGDEVVEVNGSVLEP